MNSKNTWLYPFFLILYFLIFLDTQPMGLGQVAEISAGRLGARVITQKNVWTIQNTFEYFKEQAIRNLQLATQISYGLTESLGLKVLLPIYLINTSEEGKSKGISDIITMLSWNFFQDEIHTGIIGAGIKWPTGNPLKIPTTGTGTYDVTLEFSTVHASDSWYASLDIDMILTTKRKGRKFGSQYLYELTFGHGLPFSDNEDLQIFLNLDLDGVLVEQDRFNGVIDPDTGGNVIFFGTIIIMQLQKHSI